MNAARHRRHRGWLTRRQVNDAIEGVWTGLIRAVDNYPALIVLPILAFGLMMGLASR